MKNKKKFTYLFFFLIINLFYSKSYSNEHPLYQLTAVKILYQDNNSLIIAEGNAKAFDQFGKQITSDKIIYNKKKQFIKTEKNSVFTDKKGNKLFAENFFYDLPINKIKAEKKVLYIDALGNKFNFEEFEYFEKSERGFGKQLIAYLADKSSIEGTFAEIDNKEGKISVKNNQKKHGFFYNLLSFFRDSENNYTVCENKNNYSKSIKDSCPDWSMSTTRTRQDSNKKMVYHDHAIIKIRNVPVFYTPYFSHPEPSVKRKSGFLPPSTKSFTNLGRTLRTPYFWEIDDNKDLTFTPIFYQHENSIFLAEYRQQHLNGNSWVDASYSKGYKDLNKRGENNENLNRTGGSRNHFFFNYLGNYDHIFLDQNELDINIQRISQKNYLKVNQINTSYVNQDIENLNNNITLNSYKNTKRIKIAANIFENLSTDERNSKYQYTFPYIEHNDYFLKFNQNINLSNTFEIKNNNGDTKQTTQINKITTNSEEKIIQNLGIANIIKTSISNLNIYNDNVSDAKKNLNNEIYTTIALESYLPFGKFNKGSEEILNPKVFAKYTPGKMNEKNNNDGRILSINDIYSMDRNNNYSDPETGLSLGYGIDYNLVKKNNNNDTYLVNNFSIGQIIRDQKLNGMSQTSSLNEKSSDFVGNFSLFFNNALKKEFNNLDNQKLNANINDKPIGINSNYDFILSNDLNKILQNKISIGYNDGKNILSTTYNETHDINDTQTIEANFQKSFNNNINLILKAKKNLQTNTSENNFIEINYESDCLKIGLNMSKTFYSNNDIQDENNLSLLVMFKPFGQPFAPDLTSFVDYASGNKK